MEPGDLRLFFFEHNSVLTAIDCWSIKHPFIVDNLAEKRNWIADWRSRMSA